MLGQMISDPDGIEGEIPQLPGLGLLDITTRMTADKETRQVEFSFDGAICRGYEIHQGVSEATDGSSLPDIVQTDNCMGTYIHGILDNSIVIDYILKSPLPSSPMDGEGLDFKDHQYDLLADHVRKYVDIERLYDILRR